MSLTLTKAMGAVPMDGLLKLAVGVSWDVTAGTSGRFMGGLKRKKGVDLDAIGIVMSGGEPVRYAGFDVLDPIKNGSFVHSGDNFTGNGEGDDETITVDFASLPDHVDGLGFLASAFKKGSKLTDAANVSFKVYTQGPDDSKLEEVADIWPSLLQTGNTVAVCKASRTPSGWSMSVLNTPGSVKQGDATSFLRFAMGM
jgi:stress response protein SCP2